MTYKEFIVATTEVKFYLAKNFPNLTPADTHYIWSILAHLEARTLCDQMDQMVGWDRNTRTTDTAEDLIKEYDELVGRAKPEKKEVL